MMEKKLHTWMNNVWNMMRHVRKDLPFETTDIQCSFGNYIRIDNEWEKQDYPIPTFFVKGLGEVGHDLTTFYLVLGVQKESLSKGFIDDLLAMEYKISVYGAKDFCKNLLSIESMETTFNNIMDHNEDIIQLEFNFAEQEIKNFQKVLEEIEHLIKRHHVVSIR